MIDETWGLVLGGGGAKGAYQIGVWKALHELHLDWFAGISGASVGALNAALWAAGDFETAQRIWSELCWEDFVEPSRDGRRIAARDGLRRLIREKLDLQAVRESSIPIYADLLSSRNLHVEYRKLNGQSNAHIEEVLLGSSSIPGFYGKTKIEGKSYWDGGFAFMGDNVPVQPLYQQEHICKFLTIELTNYEHVRIPDDCQVIRLIPSNSLGLMMDFGRDAIQNRMALGYRDAMTLLSAPTASVQEQVLRQYIHSRQELGNFFRSSKLLNAPLPVADAGVFWETICTLYGCQLQQHRMTLHCRFLDEKGIRRAWWLNRQDFLNDLEHFRSMSC